MTWRNTTLSEREFSEFLDTNWAPLVRYLASSLGEVEAAKDLAQEAFMQVWEHRRRIRSPRGYLYRAARSLTVNERKRRLVRAQWAASEQRRDRTWIDASAALEARELRTQLESALEGLPERTREAFTLAYLQDLSYREVAEVMGTSPKTVANQISAALAGLRSALGPLRSPGAEQKCAAGRSEAPGAGR